TAPKAFHDAQSEAAKEIKEVESRIAYVKATVKGDAKNLKVTMDGVVVPAALVGVQRPVDPGEHKFQASGDGMTSDVVSVTLKEGGRQNVEIVLKPGAAPPVAAAPTPGAPGEPAAAPPPGAPAPGAPEASSGSVSLSTESAGGSAGMRLAGVVGLGGGLVGVGVAGAFVAQARGKRFDPGALFNHYGQWRD